MYYCVELLIADEEKEILGRIIGYQWTIKFGYYEKDELVVRTSVDFYLPV